MTKYEFFLSLKALSWNSFYPGSFLLKFENTPEPVAVSYIKRAFCKFCSMEIIDGFIHLFDLHSELFIWKIICMKWENTGFLATQVYCERFCHFKGEEQLSGHALNMLLPCRSNNNQVFCNWQLQQNPDLRETPIKR